MSYDSDKKGGFEKDPDYYEPEVYDGICRDPDHNPVLDIEIPRGEQYRHICPKCGESIIYKSHRKAS